MPYGGGMGGYGAQGSLGGFLKGVAKVAGGFIVGGPAGALAGLASSIPQPKPSQPVGYNLPALPGVTPVVPTPGLMGAVQRIAPGGASGYTAVPRGYHVIKKGPNAGKVTKNRRRNFANGKALNRAISRVSGFERMVKRNRKALRGLARI